MHVKAYAKLNLFLQIVGKRHYNYHELDSVIVFTDIADHLSFEPAKEITLHIQGPFAARLSTQDNIILHAAKALLPYSKVALGATITLEKNIPLGAGLGGGSADAAATLLALNRLWNLGLNSTLLYEIGLRLGADVPICLYGSPARIRGVGEKIIPLQVPSLPVVVVNPGVVLATPSVFKALTPDRWSGAANERYGAEELKLFKNDLQSTAIELAPAIYQAIDVLEQQAGCQWARMSGSGSSCFGVFNSQQEAINAAKEISLIHDTWWVKSSLTQA
jgi:4-diphosphocytidyl-2-C-methyl-D-erythritol kinase